MLGNLVKFRLESDGGVIQGGIHRGEFRADDFGIRGSLLSGVSFEIIVIEGSGALAAKIRRAAQGPAEMRSKRAKSEIPQMQPALSSFLRRAPPFQRASQPNASAPTSRSQLAEKRNSPESKPPFSSPRRRVSHLIHSKRAAAPSPQIEKAGRSTLSRAAAMPLCTFPLLFQETNAAPHRRSRAPATRRQARPSQILRRYSSTMSL